MKATIKQQRQLKNAKIKEQVLHLLNYSESQYNALLFETACAYIEELTIAPEIAQEFLSEQLFWNWWKQQWAMVDEVFLIQSHQAPLALATMRNWYERMHRDIDAFPDPVVYDRIQDNYMKMVQGVIKKHTSHV